jgi:hypothetical protein
MSPNDQENENMGIQIFSNVREALRAGYSIDSAFPDSEGFLHARIHTEAGWAGALVLVTGSL